MMHAAALLAPVVGKYVPATQGVGSDAPAPLQEPMGVVVQLDRPAVGE